MVLNQTVLVVDDEEDIVQLISYNLKKEGFHVLSAFHGAQAIDIARRHHPDAVVLDVMMPELNGFDVCRILRSDPATSNLPVIFLTARALEADEIRGLELGADDYIQKPVSPRLLVARVKTHVQKKERLAQQFEEKLETLRESISSALPHEFRTALNGILGGTDILHDMLEDPELDFAAIREELCDLTATVNQSGRRLQKIAENFLFYTQIQSVMTQPAEVSKLRKQTIHNAAEVIHDIATLYARNTGREADLRFELDDAALHITYESFNKIVSEVVENALKFSSGGSVVTITAYSEAEQYVLRVTDRGRGMDADQIGKIAAYHQFHRNVHEQQGAGLGLILIKQLTQIFNGTFCIESSLEHGTTVTIHLPKVLL